MDSLLIMTCSITNDIVQVDIQLIFEVVNRSVWKSIPILVNHSLYEEIFSNIKVNMFLLQFHCMTSGVGVPRSGEQ